MPRTTTMPANIPIRLKTTCRVVKADSDRPIIIAHGLLEPKSTRDGRRILARVVPHNETASNSGSGRREPSRRPCPSKAISCWSRRHAGARFHSCQHQAAAGAAGPRNYAPSCRGIAADLAKDRGGARGPQYPAALLGICLGRGTGPGALPPRPSPVLSLAATSSIWVRARVWLRLPRPKPAPPPSRPPRSTPLRSLPSR